MQTDNYIHICKNGEYGAVAEVRKLFDKDTLLHIISNLLSIAKPADIQLISYVSPQKNERKYFIAFTTIKKENIETFKSVVIAFFKDVLFLDALALDDFLSCNIYPLGQWNGYSTASSKVPSFIIEKLIPSKDIPDIFESDYLKYSAYPKIQALNISNRKPVNKINYFLNKPYYKLFGDIDNALYDKINFSAGFFWSKSKDLTAGEKAPINQFLPFKMNKKKYKTETATDFKKIDKKLYPVLNWSGTANKTVPIKLSDGMITGLDVFDDDDYYNGVIIGQIGKTTLIKHIAYSYYAKGDRVFIFPLDDQNSYTEIIAKTKGQEIVFDIDNPICLNPFSLFKDKDSFNYYRLPLVEWIYLLSVKQDTLPSQDDIYYVKSNIDKALSELWEEYKDGLTLKIVFDYIEKQNDGRLPAFLDNLGLFIETYGKFFNGKSEINFDNPFVVINTSNIFHYSHPVLLGSLLTAMSIHIKVYQESNSTAGSFKNSLVFIDRLQELVKNISQIEDSLYFFYRGASRSGISLFYASDIPTNNKNDDSLRRLLSYANWLFVVSNVSDSVYHFSEKFLLDILREENILKARELNPKELLLINKNKRVSESFKYA
jgi:hypothetical protein